MSLCFLSNYLKAQETLGVNPGVDRWAIKTSIEESPPEKKIDVRELLKLANPINESDKDKFETRRIPTMMGKESLKEGDAISITGWLHLVALEDDSRKHRDGDYHIQVRTTSKWGDSCLVVEVPYPKFVSDARLKKKCETIRNFIRSKILGGKEPEIEGTKLDKAVEVEIIGQLFFDAVHMNSEPRGKRGMHSYTCWELHPIFDIKFAVKKN